jgi:hypothetical protein
MVGDQLQTTSSGKHKMVKIGSLGGKTAISSLKTKIILNTKNTYKSWNVLLLNV